MTNNISLAENATKAFQWVQTNSLPVIKLSILLGIIVVVIGIVLLPAIKRWGSKIMVTGFMIILISGIVYLVLNNVGPRLLNLI